MFTNSFSNSHGSSWIAAAAIAVAAFARLASTASASIIYQDTFSGTSSTVLNGSAPSTDNGTSATWTAGGTSGAGVGWQDNGSTNLIGHTGGAYLSFMPSSGNIYTLKATLDLTAGTTNSNWMGLGFVKSPNTNNPIDGSGAYAWAIVPVVGYGTVFNGPNTTAPSKGFPRTSGANTVSIVLNTQAAAWTYQVSVNSVAVEAVPVAFSTNPTITAVGLGNDATTATVSNFELSSAAVPEPASLGLAVVGALGLLLLKRQRSV